MSVPLSQCPALSGSGCLRKTVRTQKYFPTVLSQPPVICVSAISWDADNLYSFKNLIPSMPFFLEFVQALGPSCRRNSVPSWWLWWNIISFRSPFPHRFSAGHWPELLFHSLSFCWLCCDFIETRTSAMDTRCIGGTRATCRCAPLSSLALSQ